MAALAEIYRDAVRALGPAGYTSEQVRAWASFGAEGDAFHSFVLGAHTLVAEEEGSPIGFGGLDPSGRVAFLHVRGDRGRRGVGGSILSALTRHGVPIHRYLMEKT